MKKSSPVSALIYGVFASLMLSLGFNALAHKLDPVVQKAREASTIEVAGGPTLPCSPCAEPNRSGNRAVYQVS